MRWWVPLVVAVLVVSGPAAALAQSPEKRPRSPQNVPRAGSSEPITQVPAPPKAPQPAVHVASVSATSDSGVRHPGLLIAGEALVAMCATAAVMFVRRRVPG